MTTELAPSPLVGGRITVDLGALAANWRALAARTSAETAGVLKADAYGCGMDRVAETLARTGCRTFFVALPSEGIALRRILPDATIYVLGGFADGAGATYRTHRLRPVLGAPEEVRAWLGETAEAGEPAAIHVDSGMNRLGLTPEEAAAIATDRALLDRLRPALIMSHLATADDPAHPQTARQIDTFQAVRRLFPDLPASLANSAAVLTRPDAHHDLTRPGIAVYGAKAVSGAGALATVMTVEARIVQVRDVAAGQSVGYGATHTASRPARIAIVAAGYADGYLRCAPDGAAAVAIEGRRAPLAGRVSMDLLAVDVTALPEPLSRRGALVELFGPTIPVDEVAARCGTIAYELLAGSSRRMERRYV